MTRIAFFAPMKSPYSTIPSGDREMARNLMQAISVNGATIDLVSELRIYDKTGDAGLQSGLRREAREEARRLVETLPADTTLWVTYHNYYKAPDLLGPAVCAARGIPYVQIESTRASKRLTGAWAGFAASAHEASDRADVIFYLTDHDFFALDRDRKNAQSLVHLRPFLPAMDLPEAAPCAGPMLAAGMMRKGDKLRSYQLIAETLACLKGDWALEIAGDGPARGEVEALMAPFGNRVRFLNQLDRDALQAAYARASLFFWPGVNEAFGMVYLEAQAAGLPVVAQDRPGVRDVLAPGSYAAIDAGPAALAESIAELSSDPALRRARSAASRQHVVEHHLMPSATKTFWTGVTPLLETAK